jgi:hypothetical protein
MILQKGKKAARPHTETNAETSIWQYSLQHAGGMSYLYVNKELKLTLEEEV